MNNVHEAITRHTQKQNAHLEQFLRMEEERELAIEEAIRRCEAGQAFDTAAINAATARINAHAGQGISPTRVYVSEEMIRSLVEKRRAAAAQPRA